MTNPTVSPPDSPRLAAVRARIANLPPVFVSPALEDALVRRATAEDAREQVEQRLSETARHQAVILDRVRLGHLDDGAVDRLAELGVRAAALDAVRGALPEAVLSDQVVRATLDTVVKALRAAGPQALAPVLRYEDDLASWRAEQARSRVPVDPPASLDSDLAAAAELAVVRERLERWRAGCAAWEDAARTGTAELLDLLDSGRDYVAEGEAVAAAVAAVGPVVSEANKLRREAGLAWQAPVGAR